MAGGRKPKQAAPSRPEKTLVIDNGGWTLKAGLVCDGNSQAPRVIPNCIARDRSKKVYVGSELDECRDFSEIQFRRPVERGYLVNWEAQKEIWDHELRLSSSSSSSGGASSSSSAAAAAAALACDPSSTRLVLTEQPNALPALQANCDQVVFEEYGFASYYRAIGPTCNAYHDVQAVFRTGAPTPPTPAEICLVIDTGYSHTTVTPLLRGQPLHSAVRRIDVGGKLLTNHLARLISLRHLDVRNEAFIVNDIKEAACYVSADFAADLERCWKGTRGDPPRDEYLSGAGIARDYVLPDFHARTRGFLRDYDPARHTKQRAAAAAAGREEEEDVLTLRNERFAVPELIFNPSHVGLRQPGLAEVVRQALLPLPVGLWPGLLANVLVVGGCSLFEGFVQRLQRELMPLVPDDCVVRVARPADPITHTWWGAAHLASHADIEKLAVTKQEYDEYGAGWVARRFSAGLNST